MSNLVQQLEQNSLWLQEILSEQQQLMEKAMLSNDSDTVMKAINAFQWQEKLTKQLPKDGSNHKSMIFDPFLHNQGNGFRHAFNALSHDLLRKMAKTPAVAAVIQTRVEQVASFCIPQKDRYSVGFAIRKNTSKNDKVTKKEQERIDYLTNFVMNCGEESNKWQGDDFETFLRKITTDMLVLDQPAFEVVYNRKGKPHEFFATDGGTYRLVDPYQFEDESLRVNGYLPTHVQIYNGQVLNYYYPWELGWGPRNISTDIHSYGYGLSELEILINVVTWIIYSDQYNGKFFSQGSIPKGILKVSGNVNNERLAEFRQNWAAMVRGVQNAWKIPVIDADKFDWIDLTKSNQDMQFSKWQEYLIRIACAIYKMAPEEVGIVSSGGSQANALFERSNEAAIKFSKDKGLRPLLRHIQKQITKYIITPLDPDYKFEFVGLDSDSEKDEIELDGKKGALFMGWKELRRKYGLPDELPEGDWIMSPTWIQGFSVMQQQQQEQEGQQEGGAEGGEEESSMPEDQNEEDFFLNDSQNEEKQDEDEESTPPENPEMLNDEQDNTPFEEPSPLYKSYLQTMKILNK